MLLKFQVDPTKLFCSDDSWFFMENIVRQDKIKLSEKRPNEGKGNKLFIKRFFSYGRKYMKEEEDITVNKNPAFHFTNIWQLALRLSMRARTLSWSTTFFDTSHRAYGI